MLRAVVRGKFRQLVATDTGQAPEVCLYNCAVDQEPRRRGDKVYVSLDAGDAVGDIEMLKTIDDFICRTAKPAFSPVATLPLLVVKVQPATKYEDELGHPSVSWPMRRGQAVDVVLRPGAFGDFGYCLLLHRVKPHALAAPSPPVSPPVSRVPVSSSM